MSRCPETSPHTICYSVGVRCRTEMPTQFTICHQSFLIWQPLADGRRFASLGLAKPAVLKAQYRREIVIKPGSLQSVMPFLTTFTFTNCSTFYTISASILDMQNPLDLFFCCLDCIQPEPPHYKKVLFRGACD